MEPIKATINEVMRGLMSKKPGAADDDPWALLQKVLTKRELRHIKVSYFRRGVLGLYVDSASWLYSLNLHKQGLLNKLSSKTKAIKDIHFRIGDI